MTLNKFVTVMVAGCAAVLMSAMPSFAGQMPQGPPKAATAKATPHAEMPADMAARCKAMMADHEKLMTDMKAADQRLDALVAKMNAAAGTEKAQATAAVVNEMVTQRRTMREGTTKMEGGMMGHMMEHMQAGKDSMAGCPMMKQMGGMKH